MSKKSLKAIVKELARLNENLETANALNREAAGEPAKIAEELASLREEVHELSGFLENPDADHHREL